MAAGGVCSDVAFCGYPLRCVAVFDTREGKKVNMRKPWRVGRKLKRTLYLQIGEEPSDSDTYLGMMETPELAARVVNAINRINRTAEDTRSRLMADEEITVSRRLLADLQNARDAAVEQMQDALSDLQEERAKHKETLSQRRALAKGYDEMLRERDAARASLDAVRGLAEQVIEMHKHRVSMVPSMVPPREYAHWPMCYLIHARCLAARALETLEGGRQDGESGGATGGVSAAPDGG
jgi:hypothetical protein